MLSYVTGLFDLEYVGKIMYTHSSYKFFFNLCILVKEDTFDPRLQRIGSIMLRNGNGFLPHLQIGVAIMGFVDDYH